MRSTSERQPMDRDLFATRAQWYAAYVAGNVDRVREIESPEFTVIAGRFVQDRAAQLKGIAAALDADRWFPIGSHAQDHRIDWRPITQDVVKVYGAGAIVTPSSPGTTVIFTELWKRTESGWHVAHMHYHDVDSQDDRQSKS